MDRPKPRILEAQRNQIEMRPVDLESLLGADHPARIVWAFVEKLDLTPLYDEIKAAGETPGRPATDPRVLMALWLMATLDGIGSARELCRMCEEHDVYRWIRGGVGVNYHTLSDFRVDHVEFLDKLLTDCVASLMATGSVTLNRVAQDGMRVRASAGNGSFRRRKRLEEFRRQAEEQVRLLKLELEQDPAASNKRQQAARERSARERQERVEQALQELGQIEEQRRWTSKEGKKRKTPRPPDDPSDGRKEPRSSTTDPEARVMKFPGGGYGPGYNVQFSTDVSSQIIVGYDVINSGCDWNELPPMTEQLIERYGRCPAQSLVDAGFSCLDAVEAATDLGTQVFAPVPAPKNAKRDPHEPHPKDSPTIVEWRTRMGTGEAKAIYKQRAATAECVNAHTRNRGLRQFSVRGRAKTRAVTLWYILAHNLMRIVRPLTPAMA